MKIFFLVLLLLIPFIGVSQSLSVKFDGAIGNLDKGNKEGGVTVSIIQGGQSVTSTTTSSNGRYSVKGEIDIKKPFDVVFSKNGFASKKVSFNFYGINLEDTPAGEFKPIEKLDLDIFAERPGVDFSFLNTQSVGEFKWNSSKGSVEVDEVKRKAVADKISNLLKKADQDAQKNEAAYNAAIQAADKAFNAKSYQEALKKYEEATQYKPKEQYPILRIDEIDAILQKQKEEDLKFQQENAAYLKLIKEADVLFKAGDYEKAKSKYYEASDVSDEQYPLDQIKEINRLVKEKENEAKYKQFIEAADIMVKQKSFRSARDNYNEALKLKPNEAYPKQKIQEIDAFIKAEEATAAKKEQYDKLVTEGDQLVKEEKWEEAKGKYDEALKIEAASTYVKGQLDIVNKKIAEIKAEKEKAEKIAKLLQEGDKAINDKTYDVAISKFKEVLTLDSKNSVAPEKIKAVEEILAQQAKDKALNDQFNALVKQGDDAVTVKKYKEGIEKYNEALKLKQDPAVDIKIQEAQKLLTDSENAQKKEEEFKALIAEGVTAFNAKDYSTSLSKYEAALEIKPTDAPTQQKIGELKKLIADQKADSDKKQRIDELIQEGISLMEGSVMDGPQLDKAKQKFNEVLTLEAKNAVATAKIAEIDKLLKAQKDAADKTAKFNDFVSKGDASATAQEWEKAVGFYKNALDLQEDAGVRTKYTQAQEKIKDLVDQKKKNDDYQKAIADANALRDAKKYTEAITKYEAALAIKSTESYPQEEISKINTLISDQQALAEKQKQITDLLAEGEKLFTQKEFTTAKTKFEQVIALDATNEKAKNRIKDIENELAKQLAASEKEQKIKTLVDEGVNLFNGTQYDASESKFNEVLSLDKDNATAKKYLTDIATKKNELKSQAESETKFNAFVAQGDKSVGSEKWQEAINAYSDALKIKTDNSVEQKLNSAKEKLAQENASNEIKGKYNKLISDAKALTDATKYTDAIGKLEEAKSIKPDETFPQQEINRINQLLASSQKSEKISDLLIEGQTLLSQKEYLKAQGKYQEIISLDAANTTAISKLNEIKDILEKQSNENKINEEFNLLKNQGLQAFGNNDYKGALNYFEKALQIKSDTEVKNKISEINALLAEKDQTAAKIASLLAQGDASYNKKEWGLALSSYQEVLTIDPSNTTAKSKITSIESEMSKAKADLATAQEFNRLKKQGFDEASSGEYVKARHSLSEALKIKQDKETSDKLAEIEKIIDNKVKSEAIDKDYKQAMTNAQVAEAANQLEEAINQYKKASNLKPLEELPKTKIEELSKRVNQQKALSEVDKKYNDLMAKGDDLVNQKDYVGAIQQYNKALEVKPNEELPVIKAKHAEKLAQDQIKTEQDTQFEKIITAIKSKISEDDFKKAREYIKTASNLRPTDPRPAEYLATIEKMEKENIAFDNFMSQAANAENEKKYVEAITLYEKAKGLKPNRPEPIAKINEIRQILADKEKEAQSEEIYNQYFNAGVTNQNAKEYELAINNFRSALNVKPNDSKAIQKIAEIEAILAKLNADKKSQQEADAAFNKIVAEADDYFYSKNYQKAGEVYRKALAVRPDNQYVKKQLAESERLNKLEANVLVNQQYQKILDVADKYLQEENYEKALEYYNRALSIKSSDPYPKRKIDEINAILNPVVEQSGDLKPLGEPFDGSIIDGELALEKAEETRKSRKLKKVVDTESKVIEKHVQISENKKAELTATISGIYDLFTRIILDENDRSVDKLLVKSSLEKVDFSKISLDKANDNYERNSNLSAQSVLDDYNKVVETDFNVNTKKQVENHIDVEKVRIDEQDRTSTKISTTHQKSITTNTELTQRKIKIEGDNAKSVSEQIAIVDDVTQKRTGAEDLQTAISDDKYNNVVDHKLQMEKIQDKVADKTTESINNLKNNNSEIKKIDQTIVDKNTQDTQNNYHESIGVKENVSKITEKVEQDETDYKVKTVQTAETIKSTASELVKEAENKTLANATKNSDIKESIEKEDVTNANNTAKSIDTYKDKAKEVVNVATETTDSYVAKSNDNKQEANKIQIGLDNAGEQSRERDKVEAERIKEKVEQVKEASKALTDDQIASSKEKKQTSLDVKDEISKIENTKITKTITPNSLGEKYPEGVSQEMFQRKDEAGILSTIITRRIVVSQGRGDEYVRTQTSNSITYTKNGTPITEYVWQKETQDAKLQRHY
ncbi:MAG: hypothetical protein M9916_04000 [Crocinitomicaceae bacterium]|nr:hypothetical protein [Crocinitomicaceae bacterium]